MWRHARSLRIYCEGKTCASGRADVVLFFFFLSESENHLIHPDSLLPLAPRKLGVKLELKNNNAGGYYTIVLLSFSPDFLLLCVSTPSSSLSRGYRGLRAGPPWIIWDKFLSSQSLAQSHLLPDKVIFTSSRNQGMDVSLGPALHPLPI